MSLYPTSNAFWSASSSWFAARVEAQAKAGLVGAKALAGKEALWKDRGASYLRGRPDLKQWFKVGNGDAYMVRVDPKLARDLLDFIESINPAIVRAFDTHLGRLAFDAWSAWPVSSGLSRSLIGLEYTADGERFVGQIVNTAPYVFFIEGSPHRKLLEGPAPVTAVRMAAAIMGSLRVAA